MRQSREQKIFKQYDKIAKKDTPRKKKDAEAEVNQEDQVAVKFEQQNEELIQEIKKDQSINSIEINTSINDSNTQSII